MTEVGVVEVKHVFEEILSKVFDLLDLKPTVSKMAYSSSSLPQIERLKGRENFNTWRFAMETYLQHEDLWECVLGTELDATKITKARAKIILSVEPINYAHIEETKTAKETWDKLKEVFEDSGLTRKVNLLRTLITTRLENCSSIEEYVNIIISTSHKLNNIGFKVNEEWVGALLLAGLPDMYRPMIMALENSGTNITGDMVKTKLLQEVKLDKIRKYSSESAFYGKNTERSKNFKTQNSPHSNIRCYECNKRGHKSYECPTPKNKPKKTTSEKNKALHTFLSVSSIKTNDWYIDSGASTHMTLREDWLQKNSREKMSMPQNEIIVANNEKLAVKGFGNVTVSVNVNNKRDDLDIQDVLYVPDLSANLLSVRQLTRHGYTVVFDGKGCKIFDRKQNLLATGSIKNEMYCLDCSVNTALLTQVQADFYLWHRRLGHMNIGNMKILRNMSTGVQFKDIHDETCATCVKGKHHRLPFKHKGERATEILQLVHSDLCGPMEEKSIGGSKYFLTFIDDYSRKVFIYFLTTKDEVEETFKAYKQLVENQTGKRIQKLRTDNGGEYMSRTFDMFLKESGIRHQTTTPYTPEQNGLAERMNRTIVEKARCMLFDAKLGKEFWAEAVSTAVYLLNRSPLKSLINTTPEEVWANKKPNLINLKVFGCRALMHVPKEKRRKWDPKSVDTIFVGYCENTKGYRLFNPRTNKIVISRDVVFMEKETYNQNELVESLPIIFYEDELHQNVDTSDNNEVGAEQAIGKIETEIQENEIEIIYEDPSDDEASEEQRNEFEVQQTIVENSSVRRSERKPKPVIKEDFVSYNVQRAQVKNMPDPLTVQEAIDGPNRNLWLEAMRKEYDSLIENDTWELTNLPENKKAIQCKWVFKTKYDSEGTPERYKARLVIKGCAQKKGIDYEETYSPVVRYSSIRFLMALAVKYNMDIDQMDAVTAFLQGDLSDEIYMIQPEEFVDSSAVNKVCKLRKAIYGLKQASREWNKKLDTILIQSGLERSKVDPCIYYKVSGNKRLYIAVYVDDLLVLSNDRQIKEEIKAELKKQFKMKDLGEAKLCLGMRITRDRKQGKIWIDQEKYIDQVLTKFNMSTCNPSTTPLDPNQKLSKEMSPKDSEDSDYMKSIPYQEAVGSILYAAQLTRPDISYAVNMVSKFNKNPGKAHWNAVKRILRYLRGTSSAKLEFTSNGNGNLICYCDSDWASDIDTRRSVTGYVFLLQGGPVSWCSRRQPTVALSTTEAEYMGLSTSLQEAMWLLQLQAELDACEQKVPMKIFCDNRSAINLATTDGYHARSKHIDIRHHYVREKVKDKTIEVCSVSTDDMVADSLTKPVFSKKLKHCSEGMGLFTN